MKQVWKNPDKPRLTHLPKRSEKEQRRVKPLYFLAACMLWLAFSASPCPAQSPPTCTETQAVFYLPSPEGSQTDLLYLPLLKAWGADGAHSMRIEREPGRGGSYALSRLLLDKRTECSLAAMQIPSLFFLTRSPGRMAREDEIAPLAVFAYAPHALWVSDSSPVRSIQDLAIMSRGTAGKGGTVPVIAGVGSYTDQHLAQLALDRALGIRSAYYPLTGTAGVAALAEQQNIHACWGYALPAESMPGMRPLAVAAGTRSAALPETPTFEEQGIHLSSGSHFGIAMAAGTAEDTRKSMAGRFIRLLADPALRKAYTDLGAMPLALGMGDLEGFMSLRAKEADRLLEEFPLLPARR